MARQHTIQQQHTAVIKPRTTAVFGLVAALYLLLAGRLIFLQALRHHYYQHQADLYRVNYRTLPAQRGLLLDRDGAPLAINVPATWVYADPAEVKDPAGTAERLAPLLGADPARLETLLTARSAKDHYRSLKRRVSVETGDAVRKMDLLGIGVVADTRRGYPNNGLAAQVLGFTDRDGNGIEGVEHSQDALLRGRDGKVVAEVDKEGRLIPGTLRRRVEPANGRDLVLTIDKRLQNAADVELAKAVQEHHADHGVVVILDPHTGEILALSNAPGYDPNTPRPPHKLDAAEAAALESRRRDRAVSDLYEPGSTMKTITASAVLQDEGLDQMNVHVYCSPTLQVGKHAIHEAADALTKNLGEQNLRGILRVSSNVGMAQFGLRLGAPRLYDFEQRFGFLDYPGSGLPGEAKSYLQSPAKFNRFTGSVGWSKIQLANIAFGQGISVTPLQLAAAYAAVANDGVLMRPHIVRAVRQGNRETPVAPETVRRVMDSEVAATVRSMLGTVVQSGTGRPAQIAGYSVGGKTGSAQMAVHGSYGGGHFVASFVGMVPLSSPRLVILCSVFEPQGIHWGASVAAPVVHNLAKIAMLQMHVPPDAPDVVDWDDHLKGTHAPVVALRHRM